ncbi:hypothetical protein ACFLU2_03315 [Chloroflexota bacterium]
MEQIVMGCLTWIGEKTINIQLGLGDIRTFPRQELDISLQWVLENMNQMVICSLTDSVVTRIEPIGSYLGLRQLAQI